ncbi:MAG: LicD family protein, partial [Lachnospiraceae bacterium]|nr:LicD family protein [Lachnospiraceae bacterium]
MDYTKDYIEVSCEKEIQKFLLYLLKEFHEFCEKNNLIYNVFGGTFLGAVRHQGMIPWDDDIDVTMPRGDYEKLIGLIKSGMDNRFKIACYPDKNYCYPFAKLELVGTILIENSISKYNKHALYIDVFPVDGYPKKSEDIY